MKFLPLFLVFLTIVNFVFSALTEKKKQQSKNFNPNSKEQKRINPKTYKFKTTNNILVLDNTDINIAFQRYSKLLILFYSPVCPFSAKLLPEFTKAAEYLNKKGIALAKIDAAEDKEIAQRFQVQAFPMIMAIKKGDRMIYYGKRKTANIISWSLKNLINPLNELNTEEEVKEFLENNEAAVIYFNKEKENSELNDIKKASKEVQEFPFAVVNDEEIIKKFEEENQSLVLFKQKYNFKKILKDFSEIKIIIDFVYKYAYDNILPFNEEASNLLFDKNQSAIVYFSKGKINENEKEIFEKFVSKIDYEFKVIFADMTQVYPQKLADFIGIKKKQIPCLRILDNSKGDKARAYAPLNQEITEENLNKFLDDFKNQKLKAEIKSEEEPNEDENIGPVFDLVATNFHKKVVENDKDVIVMFYAPWCGHCKELEPIYKRVAEKVKSNKDLIFYQIDAIENELDDVNIDGYPTVLFYPGNKKTKPVEYYGDRNVRGIMNFIAKYAYNPLNFKVQEDTSTKGKVQQKKGQKGKIQKKKKVSDEVTDL